MLKLRSGRHRGRPRRPRRSGHRRGGLLEHPRAPRRLPGLDARRPRDGPGGGRRRQRLHRRLPRDGARAPPWVRLLVPEANLDSARPSTRSRGATSAWVAARELRHRAVTPGALEAMLAPGGRARPTWAWWPPAWCTPTAGRSTRCTPSPPWRLRSPSTWACPGWPRRWRAAGAWRTGSTPGGHGACPGPWARSCWSGARASTAWAASTRGSGCTPRTWTCAGG